MIKRGVVSNGLCTANCHQQSLEDKRYLEAEIRSSNFLKSWYNRIELMVNSSHSDQEIGKSILSVKH